MLKKKEEKWCGLLIKVLFIFRMFIPYLHAFDKNVQCLLENEKFNFKYFETLNGL